MRLQFYVQTKEISKNNQLYGVMTRLMISHLII